MRISDFRECFLAAAAGILLAVLAASVHDPLIGRSGLAYETNSGAPLPASMAAAHLVSGFRPLVADLMWIRADSLFRRGSLWELAALFRGIAAIDPRNSAVREFAAWHLAYNVALAERDPSRRFDWFAEGLVILSEEPAWSQFRARTRAAGGRMIADRMVSGVFPGFEDRFERRFSARPLETAVAWLSESVSIANAPAAAFASLAACLELHADEAHRSGDDALASERRSRAAAVLRSGAERFPDIDWNFAGTPEK